MKISELKDKQIAILGMGKEGISTLRFLREQGIPDTRITLLDTNPITDDSLKSADIWEITGEKYLDTLWDFDVIFKSPWVSPFQESLLPYRDRLISQAHVFFKNYTWNVIGITGTKGKSTISTLVYESLRQAGYNVKLVGNIWNPVLSEIDITSPETYDYVVYEMSSYMLQDFEPELFIGVFNNVYICHIDWHKDFETYKAAKLGILSKALNRLVNIEFRDDIQWESMYFGEGSRYRHENDALYIGEQKILNDADILLRWEHNKKNILAVLWVLDIVIWDTQKITKSLWNVLQWFLWLPHRTQEVGKYNDIIFIDDAIATTPESTIAAIETFWDELQTLFLWGEDSGFDFTQLREKILDSHIQNIVAFPDSSEKVFPEIQWLSLDTATQISIQGKQIIFFPTQSMQHAVGFAFSKTDPQRVALLSSAAPSFSLWKNYQQKAEEFKKYIENY